MKNAGTHPDILYIERRGYPPGRIKTKGRGATERERGEGLRSVGAFANEEARGFPVEAREVPYVDN